MRAPKSFEEGMDRLNAILAQMQPEQTICVRSRQYQARCRVETVEEINESTQKL